MHDVTTLYGMIKEFSITTTFNGYQDIRVHQF